MTILGVDTSHFQGTPNWSQVKGSGRAFAVLKATEGTTFTDVYCNGGYDATKKVQVPSNRAAAHAAGLIVGLYHFARAGNAAAEAAFFVKTIGALKQGEFLVLDQEVPNTVGWCKTWLDAVYAATGVRPLIYMNQSTTTGLALGNWSPVAASYGLWLAQYDNSAAQPSVAYWGAPAMKQFYDKGTVPGIAGTCDVDVFYGNTQQLLAYGKGGTAPGGFLMALTDAQQTQLLADADNVAWLVGQMKSSLDDLHGKVIDSKFPASDREGGKAPDADDMLGHILSTRAEVADLAAKVAKLQTGGVDPAEVAALVLAGLNGAQLNVQQASGK